MKSIFSYLLFITLIVFAFSCSDINTDIVTDPEISVHESGIVDSSSPNFHSKLFTNSNMDLDQCKQCHGADYSGGSSNVNCSSDQCHPAIAVHTKNIINLTSPEFHGKFIANTNWNVSSCAQCHGTNYAGGVVSPTCNSCHENAGGPEACNTCHGDFADSTMIAPPSDLSGNIATTAKGVGAHAIHLYDAAIASTVQCFDCHPTVTGTGNFIELHADGLPAELALTGSAVSAISAPDYSYSNLTCQNTYCHGNFEFLKSESTNSWIYTAD
ncbi:MAG: hypothetical protein KKD86_15320, partial [Bacteroidetes bacterium]|nr:hypothetical protein [Bacteroidota bacterium]